MRSNGRDMPQQRRPPSGGAATPGTARGSRESPRGSGGDGEDGVRRRGVWEGSWGGRSWMGTTRASATSSFVSSDESRLRRALWVEPMHDSEGRKGQVSAGMTGSTMRCGEGREGERHGTAVVDLGFRRGVAVLCRDVDARQRCARPPGGPREGVE